MRTRETFETLGKAINSLRISSSDMGLSLMISTPAAASERNRALSTIASVDTVNEAGLRGHCISRKLLLGIALLQDIPQSKPCSEDRGYG